MNSRTGESALARCYLITANTVPLTTMRLSLYFPYITPLLELANIATIFNFSYLDKVQTHVFNGEARLFGEN